MHRFIARVTAWFLRWFRRTVAPTGITPAPDTGAPAALDTPTGADFEPAKEPILTADDHLAVASLALAVLHRDLDLAPDNPGDTDLMDSIAALLTAHVMSAHHFCLMEQSGRHAQRGVEIAALEACLSTPTPRNTTGTGLDGHLARLREEHPAEHGGPCPWRWWVASGRPEPNLFVPTKTNDVEETSAPFGERKAAAHAAELAPCPHGLGERRWCVICLAPMAPSHHSTPVYLDGPGGHYHRNESCPLVVSRRGYVKTAPDHASKAEAQGRGLAPCPQCRPDGH